MTDLPRKLYEAKLKWSALNAEASRLEKSAKIVLATICNQIRSKYKSAKDAEMVAMGSVEYAQHIVNMVDARQKAHEAWALVEGCREAIKEEKNKNMKEFMNMKYGSGEGD